MRHGRDLTGPCGAVEKSTRRIVNRRTLDIAVPLVFAAAMAVAVIVVGADGTAVRVVAVVGGMGIALYYAALRKNINQ
jgi:hypothetical protein